MILSSALVIGCGYVGEGLLRALSEQGWQAIGLTLSDGSAAKLRSSGLKVMAADIRQHDFARDLRAKSFSLVVHCASSGGGGSESYQALFECGTRNVFAALEIGHFLFVSSTSVYAQTDGSSVDELSPAKPERATGKILRKAEDHVLDRKGTVAR
ncbi:MAG TPA: NAD-dependent epimerase/dehydratase family protein, partial [Chthoniobacterales bacterium]|nr:NAD-dependent epimerase/dehydratase family protein [Chthoniobacterales bacterium]